jgi:hypothetical protein
MSGAWTQRFGTIFIPQGFPIPIFPDTIPGDALVRVQNPDSAGPATITFSRNAFSRPLITRNGPIPVPAFIQLFSSFAFNGPQTNNNTSVTSSFAAIARPTLTRANANFAFCPGATAANPACAQPQTVGQLGPPPPVGGTIHGRINYTAASPAFGGTLRMLIAGGGALSNVIGGAKSTPNLVASHQPIGGGSAQQAQVVGGAYDGRNTVSLGVGVVTTGAGMAAGVITAPGTTVATPGQSVTNRNVGMPFTVGKVVATATFNNGGATMYTLTGYDARTPGGVGNLQLVAGGLTKGLNTGRIFLRMDEMTMSFTEGSQTPAISPTGMVALGSLLVLGGGYVLRRRLS